MTDVFSSDQFDDAVEDATALEVAAEADRGLDDDLTPDKVVARRQLVPSMREVEGGHAEYAFDPLPPESEAPKVPLKQRTRELLAGVNPWTLAPGYSAAPLIMLGLASMLGQWDDMVIGVMSSEIRREFDIEIAAIFALSSVLNIVARLLGPVMGYVVDRVNRVRMLAIGLIIANASSIASGFAGSLGMLAGAKGAGGIGGSMARPPLFPLLTDWYPHEVRARAVAFVNITERVGLMVGPSVAGAVGMVFGWRAATIILGVLVTAVCFGFFRLVEPVRGELDRRSLGASDEVARQEQAPIGWSEGWRAAASIGTLRKLWYATPFLTAATESTKTFLFLYFAEEFAVSPLMRGFIFSLLGISGVVSLAWAGPVADRLLVYKPGRVFGLVGGVLIINCGVIALLATSNNVWLSIAIATPLGVLGSALGPALITVLTMVIPARLRGFGLQTSSLWEMGGFILLPIIGVIADNTSIRFGMLMLIPVFIVGAVIFSTASGTVARDMRAARAASMADEETRRTRERGSNKMIICRDVDVTYDGTQVLFNVDFDVEEGELVALLGTNGAGKSTLLRAICGLQQASNGAIFLDGIDITHKPPHQNAAGGIVFMPGGRAVFPTLTVAENLRAAAWMYREDDEYVRTRTQEVLDLFPRLRERLDNQAGDLSGGEQQMVALGQAFLMKPRLLMIDELSLGLAPAVVEQLLAILERVNAEGTTVILVEQSVNVALTVARRAVFMEKGQIRFDGPTVELLRRGDLVRSVFLAGAGGGGGGGPFIASGGLVRPGAEAEVERVLDIDEVVVAFGGRQALNGVSLSLDGGQIIGIIGPNGAGKTTLFDVVSGYVTPVSGSVTIAGIDAAGMAPDGRARLGLGRSFQHARLFPALTVRENIAVALELRLTSRSAVAAATWMPGVRKSEKRVGRRVEYLVDLLNLEAYANKFVGELSTGTRRMVDIACIMAAEPRVLLLDEPSSGLAQAEVEVIGPVVRRLAKETGCGVIVIEHDMPLITALSDRLVAMELGRILAEGSPDEVTNDPRVIEAYLGASQAAIARSGDALGDALRHAGLTPPERKKST